MLTIAYRKAFNSSFINLPNDTFNSLENCVWYGPKGFTSKSALHPVYGRELHRLFQVILKVPNVTSIESREYLEQLRHDESTTIASVAEVYVYIQKQCALT
jgi:hypothetical protein